MAVQVPASLKAISSYLKTAQEYDKRDPIVAYFCRLFAMQKGIKIDSKGKDSRAFLLEMMDQLEKKKKELSSQGYEAVSDDVVAQLYIDEKALQLFLWADTEDRAAKFSKNVVKSFYTASLLYDVLTQFGELSEEGVHHQKYAKWKAAYIHKCLKNGETPVAGPVGGEDEDTIDQEGGATPYPSSTNNQQPAANTGPPTGFPGAYPPQPYPSNQTPYPSNQTPYPITPAQPTLHQPSQPSVPPSVTVAADVPVQPSSTTTATLTPQENEQAQKYCRFAASALQYEDVKTAIENLRKALSLLEK
ncbi:vacuolar protein sorting-associated protein VTA1 homolog isoform X2 [Acropora millepora]|uniref:vacuolar protein sorting-associated protein VTA1 homolog isoform X2 n=1 Tax=Acropora millepora TaxID=45264 RepID=UPI001CF131EA|nr:vacuolar protein sorting-associated protein VTA1 homolog isoform X2 [Acropora millepora]